MKMVTKNFKVKKLMEELEQNLTPPADNNHYLKEATSQNTRKAYQSDIRHYESKGGRLPATIEDVLRYLQENASTLNPRTLARRLTAIKNWHIYQNFPDPISHPIISKTLTGITRIHGKPKSKARSLAPDELIRIVGFLQAEDALRGSRDNALLQLGYFGAFRRSELVSICIEDITWQKEGIEILLRQSKTDQLKHGFYTAIPYGGNELCAVTAVEIWLKESGIAKGPIFRQISVANKLGEMALSPLAVNHILKERAGQVGLQRIDQLSSHSLRRGFATNASRAGATMIAIMRQGRWRQVNTVMEYIEEGDRFSENAAKQILQKIGS